MRKRNYNQLKLEDYETFKQKTKLINHAVFGQRNKPVLIARDKKLKQVAVRKQSHKAVIQSKKIFRAKSPIIILFSLGNFMSYYNGNCQI